MAGQGKVDWDSTDAWKKLIAAFIATGVKLDIRQVALYFGTTYDTLENRLRAIKKEAAVLKEEVATGARGEVPCARTKKASDSSVPNTPKKARTPKKSLDGVANGRVAKKSPLKKGGVKQEGVEKALFGGQGEDMTPSFSGEGMDLATPDFSASFESGPLDLEENSFF